MNRLTTHILQSLLILGLTVALVPTAHADTDDQALKTKEGHPLKVIVRENAAIYQQPDKASPSRPARQFEFYYVLPVTEGTTTKLQNNFYRIATSPRLSAAVGWLPQEAAFEWSHVQVVGFRPGSGRQLVLFFATQQDAEKWFRG